MKEEKKKEKKLSFNAHIITKPIPQVDKEKKMMK